MIRWFDVRRPMTRFISALGLVLLLLFATPLTSSGHGGVVIDSGFTDDFEWLVSINPYPTLIGEATMTLLVYQITTYEPVNDLTVQLNLAAPDTPRPCCQPETLIGPIDLTVDPQLYPGDYSNVVTFDQPGEWALQFVVTVPETASTKSFEVVVPLVVNATMGGSQPIAVTAVGTPDVDATATAFAQNVAAARQQNSPLAAPISPLASPQSRTTEAAGAPITVARPSWWLWGGLGLIPIVLIGWLILRSPQQEEEEAEESE